MCTTCGCSSDDGGQIKKVQLDAHMHTHVHTHEHTHEHTHDDLHSHTHEHAHSHTHEHSHEQEHEHSHSHEHEHFQNDNSAAGLVAKSKTISVQEKLLAKNDKIAESNRRWFGKHGILSLNLLSSPGAGKTKLLEKTLAYLKGKVSTSVIEGDQAGTFDSERIAAVGAPVVQINTAAGCHLDADMLSRGLIELNPDDNSILFIENVGNLVCPALFDLGEEFKIVILSVTEGEDKPLKYPHMFRAADLLLLNKIDLLPHLSFDLDLCLKNVRAVNPALEFMQVSAISGAGLDDWFAWLTKKVKTVEVSA